MSTMTQTRPELSTERITGYKAMARQVVHMLERSDYHDPAGAAEFREAVDRLVPCKPGFLQLASWFLAEHGGIELARSKRTGKVVMGDRKQAMAWREFFMSKAGTVTRMRTDHYRIDAAGEGIDREEHVEELVEGSQYCFKFRAKDIEVGVKYSAELTYTVKEFMPDGTVQHREGKGGF